MYAAVVTATAVALVALELLITRAECMSNRESSGSRIMRTTWHSPGSALFPLVSFISAPIKRSRRATTAGIFVAFFGFVRAKKALPLG